MKKPIASQGYRDEPDQDAVSLHTTPDDYQYDEVPELPSYSDSEAAAATSLDQPRAPSVQAVPVDPHHGLARTSTLHMPGHKVRQGNEIGIRMEPSLNDPDKLLEYIENCVRLIPPSPLVKIVGTHQETRYDSSKKKSEKERVFDFDISFSLQSFLTRENGMWAALVAEDTDLEYCGSFRKTRATSSQRLLEDGDGVGPSLQDICRDYCSSKSYLKVFRITRQLDCFNSHPIHDQIENYIRSTHYHGKLDISFPVEDKFIDIYNPHWINRARISWVRYIFYFTFLWLITWPLLFFKTKWWSLYTVTWRWARIEQSEEEHRAWKVYASISEHDWAERHKNLIKSLVLEKYQGDATSFPSDVPHHRVAHGMRGALPSTGNANMDAALNFVQGGVGLWNAVQGRGNGDPRAWGTDS